MKIKFLSVLALLALLFSCSSDDTSLLQNDKSKSDNSSKIAIINQEALIVTYNINPRLGYKGKRDEIFNRYDAIFNFAMYDLYISPAITDDLAPNQEYWVFKRNGKPEGFLELSNDDPEIDVVETDVVDEDPEDGGPQG